MVDNFVKVFKFAKTIYSNCEMSEKFLRQPVLLLTGGFSDLIVHCNY